MDLKTLRQLISFRDVRNAAVGSIVVFGGVGLAGLTFYAHTIQNARLAGTAAAASLVFVLLILIFVVPPLARNASKEASQLNLPFEFTGGGAVFLGLIAIVGFSAWNTGNNLLFLVLSFLTGAMVVGFFAGAACLKKLDVRMRFPEIIFAGEPTQIMVSLQNRKRLFPSYSVIAEVRGRERETSLAADDLARILPRWLARRIARPPIVRRTLDHFSFVPKKQINEKSAEHVFENRGRFMIKDFELSTRFPFGFFRHRRRLSARETELIVFPRVEPIDDPLADHPLGAGAFAALRRGSGQDLLALREYQPNDDLRRIDWKATARTRSLTVKEFSADDDRKILIIFDLSVPWPDGPLGTIRQRLETEQKGGIVVSPRFEAGAVRAASLMAYFTDQRAEICLVVGNEIGEPGIGNRHLYESLKRLAVAEPVFTGPLQGDATGPDLHDLLLNNEDSHIFIVSSRTETEKPVEILQKCVFIPY